MRPPRIPPPNPDLEHWTSEPTPRSVYVAIALLVLCGLLVAGVLSVAKGGAATPSCPSGHVLAGGGISRTYCAPGVPVEYR